MRAVEKIKLNLVPGGSPGGILPRVRVSQGDAQDRILQFEVYDGNEAASLSGIVSCYIGGTKPDGNGFTVDCTKNTNIVTAVLTDQATVLPGNIRCKLYLLSSTGSVRSASFELDVDPDPLADAGTSDTDITAIVQAAAMYAREAGEAAATAVSSAWDAMGASWEENHEYTVDDMVVFGQDDGGQGHIYKCILTHTSSDAILPTDTTYWEDTTLCAQISSLNSNYANKGNTTLIRHGDFPKGSEYSIDISGYKALYLETNDDDGAYRFTVYIPTSMITSEYKHYWLTSFYQSSTSNCMIAMSIKTDKIRYGFHMKNGVTDSGNIKDLYIYGVK